MDANPANPGSATDDALLCDPRLRRGVENALPGCRLLAARALAPDSTTEDASWKGTGYGAPILLVVEHEGVERKLVLHTATPNDFGHDRRADRAAEMLLAFDTFGQIPGHARALDVGAFGNDGTLVSLKGAGEFYLLTDYVEGHVYADELRRIEREKRSTPTDVEHARALARYLAELHGKKGGRAAAYVRAVRDLIGSGEGIYGIIDGYPEASPGAPADRLEAIERSCGSWRWKLRGREGRISRIHGDFHPFNVIFGDGAEPKLLDASRGSLGEPADDLVAMAVNYLFFALLAPGSWEAGFRPLWSEFWQTYLSETKDDDVLDVAPPFMAWRGLVVANPAWYPAVDAATRSALLGFVERTLAQGRLVLDDAERLFR